MAGKRAKSGKSAPAAKSGETAPRKRAKKAEEAQWQRQLLLPNEDAPSAPLRAAATSVRKRGARSKRGEQDDDARAERAAEAALALELAVSAPPAAEGEQGTVDPPPAATAQAADGSDDDSLAAQTDPVASIESSPSSASPLDAVERALLALEQRGGRAYDAISCDCARTLLHRSAHASPRAAELLLARAAVHVQRLSERFDRARAVLEARIAEAEPRLGALPDERAACARGELVNARRSLRRRACLPASIAPRVPAPQRFEDYQSASNEWVAVSALARAVDVVPEQAGPYNPLRIASDLLERIRAVSPTYLNAQLMRLEQLASMLALPELPEPVTKPITKSAARKR